MTDAARDNRACRMHETDTEGSTNLCCCTITDTKGTYDDPCYVPVRECCSERHMMGTESR